MVSTEIAMPDNWGKSRAPASPYFYDPIPSTGHDPVIVRRLLLRALTEAKILPSQNLDAFKDNGFLFDHAIRAQLPMAEVNSKRKDAEKFESKLARSATHLLPLGRVAESVWAMGWIARDAVVHVLPSVSMRRRSLTPPYRLNETIFVSRYFTRYTTQEKANQVVKQIMEWIPSFDRASEKLGVAN
jgi:hypothetical protein